MNYNELYKKIKNGEYDSKLQYPPHRSIQAESEEREVWREDTRRLKQVFKDDLRKYFETELGRPITDDQFDAMFDKVWEDGHSSGYNEVLIYASELVDVVRLFC